MTQAASLKPARLADVRQGWGRSGLGVPLQPRPPVAPHPHYLGGLFHPQPPGLDGSKRPGLARAIKSVCLWPEQGLLPSQASHPFLLQTWGLAPHPSLLGKALPHSGPQCSHLEAEDKTEQAPGSPEAKTWEPRLSGLRKQKQ